MPHPHPRGMEDGIDNRGIHADIAQLPEPLDARRIDPLVLLRNKDHFDLIDVGIHRDQYSARSSLIYRAAPDPSRSPRAAPPMPQIMPPINWLRAVRGLTIWPAANAPTVRGTPDLARRAVHAHLDELGTEGEPDSPLPGAAGYGWPALVQPLMHAVFRRALAGYSSHWPDRRRWRPCGAFSRIPSHALATALVTLAVELEPPATGAGGRAESPLRRPIVGDDAEPVAAAWARRYKRRCRYRGFPPAPAPCRPEADPPRGRDLQGYGRGGAPANEPFAIAHEAGFGSRRSQPNAAAASSKHGISERLVYGKPLIGSVRVSLIRRSSTGSMPSSRPLVHGAFQGVDVGHLRRRAHEARRIAVGLHGRHLVHTLGQA